MNDETVQWVIFRLDEQRYALPLAAVERIVRAVAVTPLPDAPTVVLGVVDVGGRVTPVFNLRRKFNLPERPISPSDQIAIVRTSHRTVALVIDSAEGVTERERTAIVPAASIASGLERLRGILQLEDGMVVIHDLDRFLSLNEAQSLDDALQRQASNAA